MKHTLFDGIPRIDIIHKRLLFISDLLSRLTNRFGWDSFLNFIRVNQIKYYYR